MFLCPDLFPQTELGKQTLAFLGLLKRRTFTDLAEGVGVLRSRDMQRKVVG
jgi:hypothetical protein